MKYFDWDEEKNEKLKRERGVSFEDVIVAMQEGKILAIIKHPNQRQYPKQKVFVIDLSDYTYLVPFSEDEKKIFLKTIFPSRKYTKIYIEEGGEYV